LFECQQEQHSIQRPYKAEAISPWKQAPTNASMPEPIQMNSLRFKKLSQKEKDRRCKEDLYLYCGRENHQTRDYPIKASASKLHKVRNVSTNVQSKVKDAELKNKDI
jgi:hypothetical protein